MPKANTSVRTSNGMSAIGRRSSARVSPYPSREEVHSHQAMAPTLRQADDKELFVDSNKSGDADTKKMAIEAPDPALVKPETTFNAWESDDEDTFVDHVESKAMMWFDGRMLPIIEPEDPFAKKPVKKEILKGTPDDRLTLNNLSGFFKLPREVRDHIYGYVADGRKKDTEYVYLQTNKND
ncbi:uncharacterized protein BDZ99DRAFT_46710 [Mytilinidion resinicola]|uniref:Uncharacterized protein n=1 Tax=Mytilinidion resinicola TaxID=574789 RepID=A0A6A6YMF4_9PEZI|nr:uncharacterized protein BDZ99DRAFT_46710 [Mytilinidion resinicola]KAF2809174.1 hypothetical protein BDZ99DRAFT_46710 [Mytilinidion resinicola]